MKCIFVATTYKFMVQYHAWAAVEARANQDWPMAIEGSSALYRMLAEPGSDRHSDASCAVFVPAEYDAHAAGILFVAFTAAHSGVIPRDVAFEFRPMRGSRLNRLQRWPKSQWARYERSANTGWW